ncbi:MAG: hypothetical protein IIA67_08620 [Planctomycetes bacterium]|nr:hypothetical protein [Planctomycetota bacterium]
MKTYSQIGAAFGRAIIELCGEETPGFYDPVEKQIAGWTVAIDPQLLTETNRQVRDRALEALANHLQRIRYILPPDRLAQLQKLRIWLELENPRLGNMQYHPDRGWLTGRGYHPPEPKSMIGIGRGGHYLHESIRQPWLVFHELVHGYDWFVLGGHRGYGSNAPMYEQAMKSGRYVSALHWNGSRRKPYHASNKMEFFAECSEAFFGTNDIYPFVRAQLREHDPETYRGVADAWKVDLDERRKLTAELVKTLASAPRITGIDPNEEPPGSAAATYTKTKQYKTETIEGWQVRIAPKLAADRDLAKRTLRLLRRDLHYVKRYVPAKAVKKLQETTIWVERDSADVPHAAYHTSAKWLRARGQNPDKAHSVEIGNANNYLRFFPEQPSIVLRLLACGYFESQLGGKNADVAAALARVKKSGKYKSVLRFDGRRVAHPALDSEYEFFAEFSETMFGTNDHFPFLRFELKETDRETYDLFAKLWGGTAESRLRK